MKNFLLSFISFVALLFVGCTDPNTGTLGGAAVGTAAGAGLGYVIGGGSSGGTAIGAVLGGLTGAAIGRDATNKEIARQAAGPQQPQPAAQEVYRECDERVTRRTPVRRPGPVYHEIHRKEIRRRVPREPHYYEEYEYYEEYR